VAQAGRVEQLIDSMLALARLESGRLQPRAELFDVSRLLREVELRFALLAKQRDVDLQIVAAPESVYAVADTEMIDRALGNLVDNALRHTPGTGRVRVSMSLEASRVRLRVTNTGPAIESRHIPHIFERFYTTAGHLSHRTGLGLCIVRRIVELHGQTLHVLSEKASGTTMEFTLQRAPLLKQAAANLLQQTSRSS
jgi:signal transduction histidine kinase